ncbi:MAG: heavy metal translocating P-type ATPase [Gemmatimonadaceae bacterium]|nr:heavy metal translocating P-type ATPase [Gemmatimonadaceae bacterium]
MTAPHEHGAHTGHGHGPAHPHGSHGQPHATEAMPPTGASPAASPPHAHHAHGSAAHGVAGGAHASAAAGGLAARGDAHADHGAHAGHSVEMFRRLFVVSLVLTVPTLVWGHMLPNALGVTPPHVPGAHLLPGLFGTATFVVGGRPFLGGAVRELRARLPGMMTLIALAVTVAFAFSVAVALGFPGMPLWEELATLVTIMLLGHWLEMRSISQAQGALGELARLLPDTAVRIVMEAGADRLDTVPVAALRTGDLLLVRPGASVPADGVVRDGTSTVNEAMITGESAPVAKTAGAAVIAGTINGTGALRIEVTGTGDATALAGIMRLVADAQASRSRAQALADRAAYWLTFVALGAGVTTLVAWLAAGATAAYAIERFVTTLVIACPHALGLAIPLVLAISTTLGARAGLLVRDRRGLEAARTLTAVVFDKTGTLTLGEHRVVAMHTAGAMTEAAALALAAAVERDAEHPVSRAIVRSAEARGVTAPASSDFTAIPGRGVRAVVEGRRLAGGGPNLLASLGVEPEAAVRAFADAAAGRGQGVVYLVEETVPPSILAAFAVADAVRPESAAAVAALHAEGIEVVMLTGDATAVAEGVARELGIDTVLAQVLPEEKAAHIAALQRQGKRVAMVGDGVNDAPALVQADVGVAIGAGTGVAVEAGDVVLVRSDPRDVPRMIRLSRASYRKMIQNLWWATGYNVVAIPLAAGVLAPWGIALTPAMGAVLMSVSTIVVAINAQLLRRLRL